MPDENKTAKTTPEANYVGTLVGESTSREFRLAVNPEAVREQDIIAVDAEMRLMGRSEADGKATEKIRVWAKVQRIERLNPLFPTEAGHELAATRTNPFATVLSMSREMVTAVCQVLGSEPRFTAEEKQAMEEQGKKVSAKLDNLRYPPKPATSAYTPDSGDIARIVVGDLQQDQTRALDIATLSNRPDVSVKVDGHAIVTRHLAILAMTGAGKSWTSRRIIEQLAAKNYPIVIFDPRGDYTGLAEVKELKGRVQRYYAQFPIFEQSTETVKAVIESLGWQLANTHVSLFDTLFKGAKTFMEGDPDKLSAKTEWLSNYLGKPTIKQFGLKPNLFMLADFVRAVIKAAKENGESKKNEVKNDEAMKQLVEWSKQEELLAIDNKTAGYLEGLPINLGRAAKRLWEMEEVNKRVAESTNPLPTDRKELVKYGKISIVALAGYTGEFQATICSLIAETIFNARVTDELRLPVLMVLEEAHNFIPASTNNPAEKRSTTVIRQIAQEGRKFRVGLLLISQRPSRLDETTLSMCNSFVIMRMVNPADQNFVRKVMETLGEDDARMLPDLDKGEALLSGQMINFPVLVKMKAPASLGEREEGDAFAALQEDYENLQKESGKSF